jgi:hypothetical protein
MATKKEKVEEKKAPISLGYKYEYEITATASYKTTGEALFVVEANTRDEAVGRLEEALKQSGGHMHKLEESEGIYFLGVGQTEDSQTKIDNIEITKTQNITNA